MPKQLSFSSRVQRLIQENNESAHAIQRLYQQIREKTQAFEQNPENKELCQKNSCWNWGRYPDPENTSGPTTFQKQEGEEHPYQIKLSAQDLHHYFQVSKGSNGELILDVKGHDHIPTMLLEHPAASRPTGLCLPIFHGVPYIIVPIFQTGHRYEDWKVSFWILPRPMGATKLHEVKIYETEAVPLTKLSIVFSNVFQNTSSLIQQHPDPAQKIRLLVRSTSPFSCVPSRFHPAPALPHPSTTTKSPNG